MSKSFLYSLWVLSIVIFLFLSLYVIGGLVLGHINIMSSPSWSDKIGFLISLIVFFPLYKLFKVREKLRLEVDGEKVLTSILVLSLWFLIPITYLLTFDKIECFEASITHSGGLPKRCYSQDDLNKYFGQQQQDEARSKTFDYSR